MIIYDNEGKTWDRYTIIPEPGLPGQMVDCLGLSENCDSPSGFSQWSTCQMSKHLGKRVQLSKLPANVRKHIKQRMEEK